MYYNQFWHRSTNSYILIAFYEFSFTSQCNLVILRSLPSKEYVNFFFDPVFVVWCIHIIWFVVDKTWEISQLVNEIKKLWYVIRYWWNIWILALQVLFVNFANSFDALVHRVVIRIRSSFWLCAWLNKKYSVAHFVPRSEIELNEIKCLVLQSEISTNISRYNKL